MLMFRQPSAEQIAAFLQQQNSLDFSYDHVGATATSPPPDYFVSHTRVQLGTGNRVFDAAASAIKQWQQFQLGWVAALPADTPIREGNAIAVIAHALGVWYLNACRIVYVIEETNPRCKYGFAYGTLPDHAATGEERFLVEMDAAENVWYDIFAFSRPRHPLAKIGLPVFRQSQRRFARQSCEVMRQFDRATIEK
jgi:uncharacterized protein (UPF0548 family)